MPDFKAIPLIEDRGSIRLQPFAQQGPASSSPIEQSQPASSSVNSRGVANTAVTATTADGELDEEDIKVLQDAAGGGDAEAANFLEQFGIPLLAGGAVLGGAVIGGKMLRDALANRNTGVVDTPSAASNVQPVLEAPPRQLALPAPSPQITDTRSTRYNMPDNSGAVASAVPPQPTQDDFYQARKDKADANARAEAAKAPLQHQEFYQARQLRDVAKRVRRIGR